MHGLHQGYSYQDLLSAFLISENLHKKDFKIAIEQQDSIQDKFDDIVVFYDGRKSKFQVKHTSANNSVAKKDFINKSSDLNLAELAKSFLDDKKTTYIIATNRNVESDSFFSNQGDSGIFSLKNESFQISGTASHKSFTKKLFIESSLPGASFDLSKPGSLEKELLESLRTQVGIGQYPNNQVSERDVAGRLILLASQLRSTGKGKFFDRDYIFKYINLNFEYGHIVQNFPFISTEYRLYRTEVVTKIQGLLSVHKYAILQGAPGGGKSHVFDDLFQKYKDEKVTVVRHFCYLEPTDRLAQERIVVDAMYGNFLHQLERSEPKIAEELKPYFSATKSNLEKMLIKLAEAGKKTVLMVDGLDHLNRVVAQNRLSEDLVQSFISDLLDLKLPENCSIFIASQPSLELNQIIEHRDVGVYTLLPWSEKMVEEFLKKHNDHLPSERKLLVDKEIIKLLLQKTEGNPLYLTYVLKEVISSSSESDIPSFLEKLPQLSSDLNNYYRYLTKTSSVSDFAVMQTLALLDFSVSSEEIKEMFPPIQKPVIEATIKKIKPILKSGIVHGGIRIYHESFRRFIIEESHKNKQQDSELYKHITDWLDKKGFYVSQRTYRYLIPYLIRSGEEDKVYSLLPKDFISQSLYFFHSPESITSNLNRIADFAGLKQRWDVYCKAVELKRALHTYTYERAESTDDVYYQAILDVQGADMFCERLMFDGKPVFSKLGGILMCQKAEHSGGNPPWDFYDVQGISMSVGSPAQIYHFQEVESANFLSSIRKASVKYAIRVMWRLMMRNRFLNTEQRQINWLLNEFDFVFGVSANYKELITLPMARKKKACLHLAVAKYLYKDGKKKEASQISTGVLKTTKDSNQILESLKLDGKIASPVLIGDISKLTASIFGFQHLYDDKEVPVFKEWYEALQILSHIKRDEVKNARKLINRIDGWYRAWLLFLVDLSLLEAENSSVVRKEKAFEIMLSELVKYAAPFTGTPRAMDLYSIREFCTDSFRRVLILGKDFSNYEFILNSLGTISSETTSYLQGSSDGPLDGEKFNTLLKEIYLLLDESKRKVVLKRLKENVYNGFASSHYYDSSSFEHLKLSSVLSQAGKTKDSKTELLMGCVHLVAYGHRKDSTLFEIIEPIGFIAKKDLGFAAKALLKTYPLAETVWRYTDGSTTKWSLTYWIESLIASNVNMAVQVMTELIIKDPGRDWRVELGTEHLCKKLVEEKVSIAIVADLYETIFRLKDTRINVSVGLEIAQLLIVSGKYERAQKIFDHIAYNLYHVSVFEYVSEKENFEKILSFAKKYKLKLKDYHKKNFEANRDKTAMKSPLADIPKTKEVIEKFKFKGLDAEEMQRLLDENPRGQFLYSQNVQNLGEALSLIAKDKPEKSQNIVLSLVRTGFYKDQDIKGLIALREIFIKNGQKELASFVSMLGLVYARGSGGWHSLADSQYNYLGSDAFKLSKKTAEKTLSSEMSYIFSKDGYFSGPVRHLVEFFSQASQVRLAENIWNEAYDVIKFRLPTPIELDEMLEKETPSLTYNLRKPINTALKELIKERLKITG